MPAYRMNQQDWETSQVAIVSLKVFSADQKRKSATLRRPQSTWSWTEFWVFHVDFAVVRASLLSPQLRLRKYIAANDAKAMYGRRRRCKRNLGHLLVRQPGGVRQGYP